MIKLHRKFPILQVYLPRSEDQVHHTLEDSLDETNQDKLNLNEGNKKLLRWHFQLGHIWFGRSNTLTTMGS